MSIRSYLHKVYRVFQRIIAPKLKYSQYIYEDVLLSHMKPGMDWLDLGCGHEILPPWRLDQEKDLISKCGKVIGVDYDLDSLKKHQKIAMKIRGDIGSLPFEDNSFDIATANMVVEHLDNPENQFKEVERILKPGGLFIFHTPNIYSYSVVIGRLIPDIVKNKLAYLFEGREEDDIFSTYYKTNSRKAIEDITQKTQFEVLKLRMLVSSPIFIVITPLAILELILLRVLMTNLFKKFRTNIIVILINKKK